MVSNPMRDPAVTVGIGGDASGLNSALDGAISKLGNFKTAVGTAGAVLGGLAAGALAAATGAAADFEEQMVEVEKVTTPETAAEMSGRIREMAAEMPVAQEALAGIAAQAGRFGVEGSDNIEQFTESVAQMAVATDLSEEEAGEAFARMTTLMDEPIDNVQNVGDAVNGLSNTMATSASEITNSATRSSGALSQLGMDTDQILALNASMNEVSASSRIAGTRLRRFAQELQDPGKAEDLAGALGMSVEEFEKMREESPNELMEMMVERFDEGGESADTLRETLSTTSRQALAGLAQNTEGWAEAQDEANEQMGDGESLTEEYNDAADTFNSRVQVLENKVKNAAIAIGEDLLPFATDLVDGINEAAGVFEDLNEEFEGNIGTISLISMAIAGLTLAVWGFAGAMASAVVAAAPLIAAFLALSALIAGLWIAWEENFLGIRDITEDVVGWLSDAFDGVVEDVTWFIDTTARGFDDLKEIVSNAVDDAVDTLGDIKSGIEDVIDFVTNAPGEAADAIQNAWGEVTDWIFGPIDDAVQEIMDGVEWIIGKLEAAQETAQAIADNLPGTGGGLELGQEDIALGVIAQETGREFESLEEARAAARQGDIDMDPGDIPGAQTGGIVQQGGLVNAHAGEAVVQAAQVTDRGELKARIDPGELRKAFGGLSFQLADGTMALSEDSVEMIDGRVEVVVETKAQEWADEVDRLGRRTR